MFQSNCAQFGGSSLGGVFHDINESEGIQTVHPAIDMGIKFQLDALQLILKNVKFIFFN